ncbi:MAG: ComF family protein [Gammaproteobacteria bacterium]|nr:ComF family protein [Gammaproteobacteria bacterium]
MVICNGCFADLPDVGQACPVCALPVLHGQVCANCLHAERIPFDRSISLYRYEYPANRLIIDLKFHGQLQLGCFLGHFLARKVVRQGVDRPDGLVPVPLHPARLAARGFNQSREIANRAAQELGVPVFNRACKRVRDTRPQHGLSAKVRTQNLKGVFLPDHDFCKAISHVAIVDDVVTTGATVTALAVALYRAGITRIDIWSCCRSV